MMLPKGSKEGTVYQLFFYVYPFTSTEEGKSKDSQHYSGDGKPYGFPLQRRVEHDSVFEIPNAHLEEVKIYHQDIYELQGPQHHHQH